MSSLRVPVAVATRAARLLKRHVFRADLAFSTQRTRLAAAVLATKTPASVLVTEDDIEGVSCEILTPSHSAVRGTLVVVHGGGFCVGSPALSRTWAAALCERLSLKVFSVDYRLAPEHPFPAAFDDVAAVLEWVMRTSGVPVALSGDSAGANLALSVLQTRLEQGEALPRAVVLLSPWLDLGVDRQANEELARRDPLLSPAWLATCADAYAAGSFDNPRVSPLLGQMNGLPPLLVQGGADDVLVPDQERLCEIVAPHGEITSAIAPGLWHDFSLQVGVLAAADQAVEDTIAFLAGHLSLSE